MAEPSTTKADLPGAVGSVLAIVIGAAAFLAARDFSDLGAVFPRTIGALMVAFGVLYLVLVARGRTRAAAPAGGSHRRRAGVALVMLAWAWGLPSLGFLASSALAFAALLFLANHAQRSGRTLAVQAVASALLLIGLYALFKHALQVPLP